MALKLSNTSIKNEYQTYFPQGSIVQLIKPIEDNYGASIPAGSRFQIESIDDMLQLHGKWQYPQRGSLAIIIGHDSFKTVEEEEK